MSAGSRVWLLALLALVPGTSPAQVPPTPVYALPQTGVCGPQCKVWGLSTTPAVVAPADPRGRNVLSVTATGASVSVACAFASMGPPALFLNGWTIVPGETLIWRGRFVPSDELDCIASGNTVVTVQTHPLLTTTPPQP